jgi:cardiolipin synthase
MLLRSGVRVFEYLPRILHAKGIIVDDWMTVGSSNLNHRSHLHDLELDIVCSHPESKNRLMEMWIQDLTASRELTLEQWRSEGFWRRLVSRIILAFRYWL